MTAAETVMAGFDYAILPVEISAEVTAAADRIKGRIRSSIIDVGADLIQVKKWLPHGEFGRWLKVEFGMTERSAENYMSAAALVAKYEIVSVMRPTTLYLLAAPSTPASIRQEVVDRLNVGEVIPDRAVTKMVDQAKWEQKEEQKRAEREAEIAKLSPRARRSRAEREAEAQREEEKAAREREEREAARLFLRDLVRNQMGDRLPPDFIALLKVAEPWSKVLHRLFENCAPL